MAASEFTDPAGAVVSAILLEKGAIAEAIEKHNRLADECDIYAKYHRARADVLGVEYDRAERRRTKASLTQNTRA
jgi:hypothetical protein